MSEFKFVQWGKGVPADYQRLNAMMLNDQYLKDRVDPSPRGLLIWKQTGQITSINPSGTYQAISGFTSLRFDVEANRMISFYFNPGVVYSDTTVQVRFRFVIDSANTSDIGGGGSNGSNVYFSGGAAYHIASPALSQGSHTVSVQMIADAASTNMILGNNTQIILAVRDEGAYISETA